MDDIKGDLNPADSKADQPRPDFGANNPTGFEFNAEKTPTPKTSEAIKKTVDEDIFKSLDDDSSPEPTKSWIPPVEPSGAAYTPVEKPLPTPNSSLPTPPANENLDPAIQPFKKSPGGQKTVMMAILGLAVLAGATFGAYYYGYTSGKTKGQDDLRSELNKAEKKAEEPQTETEQTPVTNADPKLNLTETKQPDYKDETITGRLGEQIASSDGLVMKVVSAQRNFNAGAGYQADPAKELVKINISIGNITKDKTKDISSFSFRLEDGAKARFTPENIASFEGKFDSIKLAPGSQSTGSIVFSVKKGEAALTFVREQKYRITGENREVTMQLVVPLPKPTV